MPTPETLDSFCEAAARLIAETVKSQARSTRGLLQKAIASGADVRVEYSLITLRVAVSVAHPNGKANVIFSCEGADDDDERRRYG